jgi:flagellar protein FliJ
MSRTFRLQRVLDLRERAEQETARRLAASQANATAARDAHDSLQAVRHSSRDQVEQVHQGGSAVGHLQHLSFVLGQLDRRIAGASESMIDAEQAVTRVRGELELAVRDRRMLERLREKHVDDTRLLDLSADRVQMDELALSRFARQRADDGTEDSSRDTTGASST